MCIGPMMWLAAIGVAVTIVRCTDPMERAAVAYCARKDGMFQPGVRLQVSTSAKDGERHSNRQARWCREDQRK
jgi:hypothetical protein